MKSVLHKDFLKTAAFALFVSLALLVVVFEIKKFQAEEDTKEIKDRVLSVDPAFVNRISIKGYMLIRDRDAGVWRAVSPITDYMNFGAVEDWLAKALSFDGRKLSDEGEVVRWADFGFSNTSPRIIYYAKKDAYSLSVSKKFAFDGSVYIKYRKNNESPLLFSSDPEWKSVFDQAPDDLRSLKAFDWNVPEPSSQIEILKVKNRTKETLSIFRKEGQWKSELHPDWTLNSVKINSFLSDVQQYMHKGFAFGKMRLEGPEVSLFVAGREKNGFSINLYEKDKKIYGVTSYRPEHVFELDSEALIDFDPSPIEFREFSDLIGDFKVDQVKAVKIRKNSENKVFRFKDSLWAKTDGKKIAAGFEFNGAKVFSLLEAFKKIQYKRYILERDVIFRSAKRKLYFYKNQSDVDLTYSVGQSYPCDKASESSYNCVLVATNQVQGYYGIALKADVDHLFDLGFIQKIPEEKPVEKINKNQTHNKEQSLKAVSTKKSEKK